MIRKGTLVRLRKGVSTHRERKQTAKVSRFYADIPGGVVLETSIANSRAWNIRDLERADKMRRKKR